MEFPAKSGKDENSIEKDTNDSRICALAFIGGAPGTLVVVLAAKQAQYCTAVKAFEYILPR